MTDRYLLIGSPIRHSLSPAMHNAAFRAAGIDAIYELKEVGVDDLLAFEKELYRTTRWKGLNVTTPLKTRLNVMGERTPRSRRAGAVNTLTLRDGVYDADLTDIDGIRIPIERRGGVEPGSEALVMGSGGAARAAAVAFDAMGLIPHVVARTVQKAEGVLKRTRPERPGEAWAIADRATTARIFPRLAVVFNATSNTQGRDFYPVPWDLAGRRLLAFDAVYWPRHTTFLVRAVEAGHAAIEGWEMLLEQGIVAWEHWTGRRAPRGVMMDAIHEALRVRRPSFEPASSA